MSVYEQSSINVVAYIDALRKSHYLGGALFAALVVSISSPDVFSSDHSGVTYILCL